MDITTELEKLASLPLEERYPKILEKKNEGVVLGVVLEKAQVSPMQFYRWRKKQAKAKPPASLQSEGSQS
jgi:hypothetical protein